MDAAERIELDGLRRRAYGPAVDVRDELDEAALARLIELEDLARAEHGSTATAGAAAPLDAASHPSRAEARAAARAERNAERRAGRGRPGRTVAVAVVSVAVVGAAVAASALLQRTLSPVAEEAAEPPTVTVEPMPVREAYSLVRDRAAVVLAELSIDEASARSAPEDEPLVFPDFPSSGPMRWAQPLGEHAGWAVWVGGADGALQPEHCILVERGGRAIGRCVPAVLREQSALAVAIDGVDIPAASRPEGLTPGRRVGLWWKTDDTVVMLLADETPMPDPSPALP
ncbi:hypothetical protein AB1K54_07160 [Microbacterium sp. BWT-B31]|uniref:hypothetical protein n=1 Tax=Microbacterium sp. BWT-B31 TaxID=3232072 RepID=UPI003526D20E